MLLQLDALFAPNAEIREEAIFIPNLTQLESSSISQGCQPSRVKFDVKATVDAVQIEIASYY